MITLSIRVPVNLPDSPTRDIERQMARSIKVAAEYVRGTWMSAVSGTVLPGMRGPVSDDAYLRSLGMPSAMRRASQYEYVVTADYERVAIWEMGFPSYDMKPMLLGGSRARVSKDGRRYNIIPFRFGTPQSGGESRVHFQGEQTMTQEVYNLVKDGTAFPRDSTEGQRTKLHELLGTLGEPGGVNAEALIRGLSGPMTGPYTWATGLYAGMQRTGSPGQRRYYTFRTVSDPLLRWTRIRRADGRIVAIQRRLKGSDPDSWIHPGRPSNAIMRAVVEYSRPTVEGFINRAVTAAFHP